jgi:TRAP-type uncharacterized transport system fused permease subunit
MSREVAMRFKGGLFNGTLASLYGFTGLWLLFFKEDMEQHRTMQKISYVLAFAGIAIALYWIATREVTGIPFMMLALNFLGMARYSEHMPLDIGAAAMSAVSIIIGVLMYTRIDSRAGQPPG